MLRLLFFLALAVAASACSTPPSHYIKVKPVQVTDQNRGTVRIIGVDSQTYRLIQVGDTINFRLLREVVVSK